MQAEPYSWNVVVNGAWNTSILSPDGVRRRLFELEDGTPIEIEVAVDRPSPFRISHAGLVVVPAANRLEIAARVANRDSLRRACAIGRRALSQLPETPVSAVGVNIRYRFPEVPDALLDALRAPVDTALSDAEFTVLGGLTRRTVLVTPGQLNVSIEAIGTGGTLQFNFHRAASVPNDLSQWLDRLDDFWPIVERMFVAFGVDSDVRREIDA